jgi:phosphocarrier protein FPr
MPEIRLTIQHEAGLHARPLSKFVKTARGFDANIQVTNLTREKGPAAATSAIKLMLLAVLKGQEIKIEADGPEAEAALAALQALIDGNFGE